MDKAKPRVCFVGWNRSVSNDIVEQLRLFFGDYINPIGWALKESAVPPVEDCDIFIASVTPSEEYIRKALPPDGKVIFAQRALNPKKIINLLQLEDEKEVLVCATSENGARMTIQLLENLGLDNIVMHPYHAESVLPKCENATAIITGQSIGHLPGVTKIIDLGTKKLDISTLAELAELIPAIPKTILNRVAQDYVRELFAMGTEQHRLAKLNLVMQKTVRSVLDTVSDAVVALDENQRVTLLNRQAEAVFGMRTGNAVGRDFGEMVPEPQLADWLRNPVAGDHQIVEIGGNSYTLSVNGVETEPGVNQGAVVSLREVRALLEIEGSIRNRLRKSGHYAKCSFSDILGNSPALVSAKKLALQFSATDLPVLIQGNTGTGKDLFAQSIHNASGRRKEPYVAVNFAALSEGLVESELFGYADGAFTGAKKGGRAGLFEQAHKGTIFLDEIGEVSPDIQKKLLRVLENKEIRRVGGDQIITVDVRIVAATNRNLLQMMQEGTFRPDLFYRLGTLSLDIPPLAERKEDIVSLFHKFYTTISSSRIHLSADLEAFLLSYDWPGNVRELQNTAHYLASIHTEGTTADCSQLPGYMVHAGGVSSQTTSYLHDAAAELERSGCAETARSALRHLAASGFPGKAFGRGALLASLRSEGLDCTEHDMKKTLVLLNALGLCKTGATRKGTSITRKGVAFLQP